MRAFLSTLNSPSMTDRTFEKIERRVGPRTVQYAEISCEKAIQKEKEFSKRYTIANNFAIEISN
jgi:hypothetical protein